MIREATAADVAAVHALVERAFRGESARAGWTHEADLLGGQRIDADGIRAIIDDPAQTLWVTPARDACMAMRRVDTDTVYLGMLTVDPARQGEGLGKALLTHAARIAADDGARRIEMTVIAQRPELIAWYCRHGYRATGRTAPFPYGDTRFGEPRRGDLVFRVLERDLRPDTATRDEAQ